MTKKEIENIIIDIMLNDGPDGHCDGSDIIAGFVKALLDGKGEEWCNEYFKHNPRTETFKK